VKRRSEVSELTPSPVPSSSVMYNGGQEPHSWDLSFCSDQVGNTFEITETLSSSWSDPPQLPTPKTTSDYLQQPTAVDQELKNHDYHQYDPNTFANYPQLGTPPNHSDSNSAIPMDFDQTHTNRPLALQSQLQTWDKRAFDEPQSGPSQSQKRPRRKHSTMCSSRSWEESNDTKASQRLPAHPQSPVNRLQYTAVDRDSINTHIATREARVELEEGGRGDEQKDYKTGATAKRRGQESESQLQARENRGKPPRGYTETSINNRQAPPQPGSTTKREREVRKRQNPQLRPLFRTYLRVSIHLPPW
jgi:hypothetical protein